MLREPSNRKNRSVQRCRSKHDIHAVTVWKSRIRNRRRFTDDAVTGRDNTGHNIQKPFFGSKPDRELTHRSPSFNKDRIGTVDHNFRDGRIVHKILQDVELSQGMKHLLSELLHFGNENLFFGSKQRNFFINQLQNPFITDFRRKINSLQYAFAYSPAPFRK